MQQKTAYDLFNVRLKQDFFSLALQSRAFFNPLECMTVGFCVLIL